MIYELKFYLTVLFAFFLISCSSEAENTANELIKSGAQASHWVSSCYFRKYSHGTSSWNSLKDKFSRMQTSQNDAKKLFDVMNQDQGFVLERIDDGNSVYVYVKSMNEIPNRVYIIAY